MLFKQRSELHKNVSEVLKKYDELLTQSNMINNEVRNAYNRANYLERRKPVMEWWSDYIEKAATGNMSLTGNSGLKIVSIK